MVATTVVDSHMCDVDEAVNTMFIEFHVADVDEAVSTTVAD